MGWEKHVIGLTVLAFGLLLGLVGGTAFVDLRRETEVLQETVGDLAIRIAVVERALPGGGPDALRDIVGDVSARVDQLERLAVIERQLEAMQPGGRPFPRRGSQPVLPGQDLRGMTIPGSSAPPDRSGDEDP